MEEVIFEVCTWFTPLKNNFLVRIRMLQYLKWKVEKNHPQKFLRKTEIDFFFLLPWACSKMLLIDQLYIKLGFLHREYQFSIFIRQIHFFVSKLLILRRWNERFLEFHQFHSGDLYSHLIFSAMIKLKYLTHCYFRIF